MSLVTKPRNSLKIIYPEVKTAYFAEKVKTAEGVTFKEIEKGILEEELYIVLETAHLQDGHPIKVVLFQYLETDGKVLLKNTKNEELIVSVGNYKGKGGTAAQAIGKVTIGMEDSSDSYYLQLQKANNLYISIAVDAEIDDSIDYEVSYNLKEYMRNYKDAPNLWYNGDKKWFELKKKQRAPWMEIAIAEAQKAKGVKESETPLKEMVKKYHTYVGHPKYSHTIAWCASFINWALNKSGYNNIKSTASQGILWKEGNEKFKKIDKPIYGAIAVFTNYRTSNGKATSFGHVTFLYGKTKDGKLICLGGNQGNRLKFSTYKDRGITSTFYLSSVNEKVNQKFNGFYIPKDYTIKESDYLTEKDITTLTEANKKIGLTKFKSSKNESTR